ncbi:MAG: aldehyde ferredoxin oxidoreductase family protein [Thermoleophilia bacterium]|nr:aldehyde ferredoxin oxidoreductase family protein [Thermoleophilia bacterium]
MASEEQVTTTESWEPLTCKILRVNLSTGAVTREERDERYYRKWLGGSGLISEILLKELPEYVDALGPENKLVFACGPVTGTAVYATARHAVGAKSPLSGGIALCQAGEYWGTELRRAGYDVLIVEGKAEKPVFVYVKDGEVSIRDAGHLWGLETKETQAAIRSELGDERVRVAMIGPGGENLVSFACIMHGPFDAAGRGGLGAVMGAKNLKAVAVRGTGRVPVYSRDEVKAINEWLTQKHWKTFWLQQVLAEYGTGGPEMEGMEEIGHLPVKNWKGAPFPGVKNIHGGALKERLGVGMEGCFGCPLRCKKRLRSGAPYFVDEEYGGPEYEAICSLGTNCMVDDPAAVAKANEICNANSLDVISTGTTIAFAMECFERGLITREDTGGLELRFGNGEALVECVRLIARREGIGALLAEGSREAAAKIGKEAEALSVEVKGVHPGMHEPRRLPAFALGFMVNPNGADHCANVHDDIFVTENSLQDFFSLGFLDTLPLDDISPRKVALFKVGHIREFLNDCLLTCHLAYVGVNYDVPTQILRAVTGWNVGAAELIRASERILTAARLFNIRQGLSASDDVLPVRFFEPKTDGPYVAGLDPEKMERAKRYYYFLMGWDEVGVPLPERVEELYIYE